MKSDSKRKLSDKSDFHVRHLQISRKHIFEAIKKIVCFYLKDIVRFLGAERPKPLV